MSTTGWLTRHFNIVLICGLSLLVLGCLRQVPEKVQAKALRELRIVPNVTNIPVSTTLKFAAFDGLAPYVFTIDIGGGTIDAKTGEFKAPATKGESVIRVTDAEGTTKIALAFIAEPLTIVPEAMLLTVSSTKSFSAKGGAPPYEYKVIQAPIEYLDAGTGLYGTVDPDSNQLAPFVDPSTGLFKAPATPGTFVVQIADSNKITANAVVTVYPRPSISPVLSYAATGRRTDFQTSGGTPPLKYTIVNDDGTKGTIDPVTGLYRAPVTAMTVTIRVTDSLLFFSESTLTVYNPNQIAAGEQHSCYLRASTGAVSCWGDNTYGALGTGLNTGASLNVGDDSLEMGDFLNKVNFTVGATPYTATQIAVGGRHSCAIVKSATISGAIRCWGSNSDGQLGTGHGATSKGDDEAVSTYANVNFGAGLTAEQLALGSKHTCALVKDAGSNKSVRCWGDNSRGQLGIGDNSGAKSRIGDVGAELGASLGAVDLGAGFVPTSITAGNEHTCAVSSDGRIKCWGANTKGQLGDGTPTDRLAAQTADIGTEGALKVFAAGEHTCALTTSRSLKCWGDNTYNQLGKDTSIISAIGDNSGEMGANLSPVQFAEDLGPAGIKNHPVEEVIVGKTQTCAVLDDKSMPLLQKEPGTS